MPREAAPAHIIKRAVLIWKRALANPVYRNTRPEEGEEHAKHTLINALVHGRAPKNNTPDVLEVFGQHLEKFLTEGYTFTPSYGDKVPYQRIERLISVDYQPDQVLSLAAQAAGLVMPFPLKTNMELADDSVSFSMGYGAPYVRHYPLPDGRWFTTTLRGYPEDTAALIAYVAAHGDLPFATIDREEN